MSSKLIDQFQSDSQLVSAGAAAMAEEVGTMLAEHFAPYLEEGEKAVDWVLAQHLIGRLLAKKSQDLDELDQRLEVERAANKSLRAEREHVATELRRELRSARLLLDESFGRDLPSAIFARRKISQVTPGPLVRLARETAAALRSPEVSPMRSLTGGGLSRAGNPGRSSRPPGPGAGATARARGAEAQAVTFGVGEKIQRWQEANTRRMRVQDLLFGIYRGAGYDHLAARLRPKRARRAAAEGMGTRKRGNKAGAQLAAATAAAES